MDKETLKQYISLKAEAKDLEDRVLKLRNEIKRLESKEVQVADCVKGTRGDGTYGNIPINGYPYMCAEQKKRVLMVRERKLARFQRQLLEMAMEVENYVASLEDSRIRRMIRYRYLDDLSWIQVAHRMGKRYTADSCRVTVSNFFKNEK